MEGISYDGRAFAKGVVLELRAVKFGLEANLNLGGVTISMR